MVVSVCCMLSNFIRLEMGEDEITKKWLKEWRKKALAGEFMDDVDEYNAAEPSRADKKAGAQLRDHVAQTMWSDYKAERNRRKRAERWSAQMALDS